MHIEIINYYLSFQVFSLQFVKSNFIIYRIQKSHHLFNIYYLLLTLINLSFKLHLN